MVWPLTKFFISTLYHLEWNPNSTMAAKALCDLVISFIFMLYGVALPDSQFPY